jgi:hypothetical protein
MSWHEWHQRSEQAASEAHLALRQGDAARAKLLFKEAADAELKALEHVDQRKARTRGVTAVSATSLMFKAGEIKLTEELAKAFLGATPALPGFAMTQLLELLQSIWSEPPGSTASNKPSSSLEGRSGQLGKDHLRPESLDWALTHIKRFGDTDIFPPVFEFTAIQNYWEPVKEYLLSIDLATYEGRPHRRYLVPKATGGFRVAVQLDPLDSLVYLGAVYEAGSQIEKMRVGVEKRVACAYRIQIDAKGQLFRQSHGWDEYAAVSRELAESKKYPYVLTADISDFYNQVGHHRIRNALEHAGIAPTRAKNLENYLMNLTRGQSRGIPVGPSPSIVLAEACLADVDDFLLLKGYTHTRYVDDFRIFCRTKRDALQALHDLSEYLYTSHRLSLQSEKTRVKHIERFMREELVDPQRAEEQTRARKLGELIASISGYGDGGEEDIDESSEVDQQKLARETLKELFEECVKKVPLHLGLARYLLRRGSQLDTNVLQSSVLANLERLAPVMRDVCMYLRKSSSGKDRAKVGRALIAYADKGDLGFLPFIRLWVASFLIHNTPDELRSEVIRICEEAQVASGLRLHAMLAQELRMTEWIRMQKEIWQNHDPWTKRSIIWAASALGKDERNYWLKRVQNAGDILDKAVANAALSN